MKHAKTVVYKSAIFVTCLLLTGIVKADLARNPPCLIDVNTIQASGLSSAEWIDAEGYRLVAESRFVLEKNDLYQDIAVTVEDSSDDDTWPPVETVTAISYEVMSNADALGAGVNERIYKSMADFGKSQGTHYETLEEGLPIYISALSRQIIAVLAHEDPVIDYSENSQNYFARESASIGVISLLKNIETTPNLGITHIADVEGNSEEEKLLQIEIIVNSILMDAVKKVYQDTGVITTE